MSDRLLEPRIVRMPDLVSGSWFNTNQAIESRQLRGKVVLVDFWDYTCVNCLRTLPYLREWYDRYRRKGLEIIGIHSPEFRFAQFNSQVEKAIDEQSIAYPVLLDNGYQNWERFANKAWPTKHLIDQDGYIRLRRQGEGHYRHIEEAIQQLLRQRDPSMRLPALMEPVRAEDGPGAVCYRPTPELYAGYQMGGLFGNALGNAEGYAVEGPVFYEMPPPDQRSEGQFYLDGIWRGWPESMAFAGQRGGRVVVPYSGASVNLVLSPAADPVTTELGLAPAVGLPAVTVRQDGRYLTSDILGSDVALQPDGQSVVVIDRPRMYQLVRNPTFEPHELELTFDGTGLAVYAFTFTSCLVEHDPPLDAETYLVN